MANDFHRKFGEISKHFPRLVDRIPSITVAKIPEWSDHILTELRQQSSFRDNGRGLYKHILSRFYDFYFSGLIREKDTLVTTVADVIAIARTPQGKLWNSRIQEGPVFYPLNNSNSDVLITARPAALPELVYPATIISTLEKEEYKKLTLQYTEDSSEQFKTMVLDIIGRINIGPKCLDFMTYEERELISLSGFLALTLCRAATKDRDQMSSVFFEAQYRENITVLTGWPANAPWSPPCGTCLDLVNDGLANGLSTTSRLFVHFAYEYVQAMKPDYVNSSVKQYLAASVLTHTARYGLGTIQLIDQACTILDIDWKFLCENTYSDKTFRSWKTITTFFNEVLKINACQYGYNWARIINRDYLQDLRPEENLFLSGILAGLIEHKQGPSVWKAEWAKGRKEQLMPAKRIGSALYFVFQLEEVAAIEGLNK